MKFALLFPGQGSQKVGMGLDLIDKSEKVKDLFKTTDNICKANISDIFLNGPETELNQTKYTQVSIVAVSVALTIMLEEKLKEKNLSLEPIGCCGHSLGEFTALWYSNIIKFEELIKLVSIRGNLMQNAPEGGMAAILNLEAEKIENLINEEPLKNKIVIANYNSPNQIVISGEKKCFEIIPEKVKSLNGKAIILPVSGAFHSPLMQEPSKAFSDALDNTLFNSTAKVSIYQNVDGNPSKELNIILDKLKKQMTSSVFWTQTINNLVKDNVDAVIEIGPGKVLSGLVKKINPDLECYNISDYKSLEDFISIYESKLSTAKP